MSAVRCSDNPIVSPEQIEPSRPGYDVVCAFNAGVARHAGDVILLIRVAERPVNADPLIYLAPVFDPVIGDVVAVPFRRDDPTLDFSDSRIIETPRGTWLTSISHLRLARSSDGRQFTIDRAPALFPSNQYETFGIEDCRITQLEDDYLITYTAVSQLGITCGLARTRDFQSYERLGNVFHPDNKDVVIFPERIGGKFYALHRPFTAFGMRADIWIAQSPDLRCWGNHKQLMGAREKYWDDAKVGGSCVPFRTDAGWIELYHGVGKDDLYSVGAVLLDIEQPWKVLKRSRRPVLSPEAAYEKAGFWGRVIFPCGCLCDGRTVTLYYGAADRCTCMAELSLDDIFETLE